MGCDLMIGKLITAFFNFLLTIIMSIIQLICMPLNALFNGVFPDLSNWMQKIDKGLVSAFSNLSWSVSIIPPTVREALLLIFTIELSLLLIMRSTHATSKAWKILQKLKFW